MVVGARHDEDATSTAVDGEGTATRGVGLLLPERTRLFHIGPPKTGTTSLQAAAAASRSQLLEHGVLYPGKTQTHRKAVAAFIGRPVGWVDPPANDRSVPKLGRWHELMAEVEADDEHRIMMGHEFAASANDETAARFVEAIGPRTHVAITLRPFGTMLPSIWQQYNKVGNLVTFESWLQGVFEEPRTKVVHTRHDQGRLVTRWARAAGAENVTVVVLDPDDRGMLFRVFEDLLGLPHGLFESADTIGRSSNRSLTPPEIELLRRLNLAAREAEIPFKDYNRLVTQGAAARMVDRQPHSDEPRLRLPAWAAEAAAEDQRRFADQIRASGVRVVGDVDWLLAPPPVAGPDDVDHTQVDSVPLDVAVAALTGAVSAGVGRGPDFAPPPESEPQAPAAPDPVADPSALSAGALARELARRTLTWPARVVRRARRE